MQKRCDRRMIREIDCDRAIDYEYPPDGGRVPVLDAYDGCQLSCPYCFQWQNQPWNQDLLIKTNLPDVLARELDAWDPTQTLYVGSRSDPYMPLEGHFRLTRRIIEILASRGVPCYLSTKSDAPAFFDDLGLFVDYREKLTIGLGQANLAHLRATRDPRDLPNLHTANRLTALGVPTQVFITPVLPGITDVAAMISVLSDGIPVFLDKLRLEAETTAARRFLDYIRGAYPELEARYDSLVREGSDPYYGQLAERYRGDPRVKFVFGVP
jgi:DNA repair photolyase